MTSSSTASGASGLGPWSAIVLLAPLTVLMFAILLYPLGLTLWTSLYDGQLSLRAYAELASSTLFLKVLRNTFEIAITGTLVSLVFGYPVAMHLAAQPPRRRTACLVMVMLPFWTSILVKSFALVAVFGNQGLVNQLLGFLSGGQINLPMMFNRVGVVLGMINFLLPFMILSILGSLLALDRRLILAAETMGAGPLRIFWKVILPLSMPGVVAGVLINVTLSIGMYITPALLGGRQDMMVANLVDFYTRQTLDWTAASATAVALLAISGLLVAMLGRVRGGLSGGAA
ncbi:ABC transporter permease [Azospirillum sp. YIM B02556]|uniref:ABC transporter permease n=1 Tax=Azospirillum endophyticum TaxID=2800326 RepID=A0ABS1FFN9_9PROT|nr:ABC transporter permease [Azospirillum endophyticum]MBK1842256.1 ABC transporter permease [Azospirillum endophyticum]